MPPSPPESLCIIQASSHLLLHLPIQLHHELDLERKRRAGKVCLDERGRDAGGLVPAEGAAVFIYAAVRKLVNQSDDPAGVAPVEQRHGIGTCSGTEAVQSE